MFGSNKKKETSAPLAALPPSGSSHALNSLVHGTRVEGTISSENDIRIDGAIKGQLTCKAKVIIGPTGLIEGEIDCNSAVIEGRFEGTLRIADVLTIKEKARVTGEIHANKLIVQPGAVINGSFDMGKMETLDDEKQLKRNGSKQHSVKNKVKLIEPVTGA